MKKALEKPYYLQTNHCTATLLAVMCLTGVLGHRFYNQPQLNVGTIAPHTVIAPFAAVIEDTKATETNRQVARTVSTPVLMLDSTVNQQIERDVERILTEGNELRRIAGPFPFAEVSILSTPTQRYLRKCQEPQWQNILDTLVASSATNTVLSTTNSVAVTQSIKELKTYASITSRQKSSLLIARIYRVRQQYAQALAILDFAQPQPQRSFKASLLDLTDDDWQKTQVGIRRSGKRILSQGVPSGLPLNVLQQAVSLQVQSIVPKAAEPLAVQLLLNLLKPNLKEDVRQTRMQVEQAAAAVEPVMTKARQGEVIVQAGEVITQPDFVLLDHFKLSRREINWLGLSQLGVIVSGAVGFFQLVIQRYGKLRQCDYLLVLLLTLSVPLLQIVGMPYTNLSAVGLLLGSFYGSFVGVTVVGLLTALLHVSLIEIGWQQMIAGAAGGILGSRMAGRLRSREELALLGGAVGITQGVVFLLVSLISNATPNLWYLLIRESVLFGLSGLAWSIVALGLSPYLEHLFDLITPIRLAELANPNRALLKRLATKAPGTFQHTLFVSTLAEAAAKTLKCNVELVRAGTLYHDIGKMHDPLGFIENQMAGPNKHDKINDPWLSAELIKKHVREGLVIARKHRLPTAIQAFIPEHQGTMLIAYFYHQAVQISAAHPDCLLRESDFRYDGPIPQTRETGIVMLADSCEAALRSLKDASYEEALAMVNKILRSRWQDNQLVDSGLTRTEMSQIGGIFVEVWLQFHHKRIAYPKVISK